MKKMAIKNKEGETLAREKRDVKELSKKGAPKKNKMGETLKMEKRDVRKFPK